MNFIKKLSAVVFVGAGALAIALPSQALEVGVGIRSSVGQSQFCGYTHASSSGTTSVTGVTNTSSYDTKSGPLAGGGTFNSATGSTSVLNSASNTSSSSATSGSLVEQNRSISIDNVGIVR
jgi:hypothetical protein